jgi:hypothetical protein
MNTEKSHDLERLARSAQRALDLAVSGDLPDIAHVSRRSDFNRGFTQAECRDLCALRKLLGIVVGDLEVTMRRPHASECSTYAVPLEDGGVALVTGPQGVFALYEQQGDAVMLVESGSESTPEMLSILAECPQMLLQAHYRHKKGAKHGDSTETTPGKARNPAVFVPPVTGRTPEKT